jgi:hypothetical protein
VRRTQLSESLTNTPGGVGAGDGLGEHLDDLVVAPEVDEVLERQVDRAAHGAYGTEIAKLVGLSLTAGHVTTIHPRPDAPLHSR